MDIRVLWNKVGNLRSHKIDNFPTIFVDDNSFSHPLDIADNFANFWCNLGSDDAFDPEIIAGKENLKIENLTQMTSHFNELNQPVTIYELNEVMMTLRGSTPARDKITYAMIKHSPHILKERLCQLYNRIMTTGVYPHDWKLAVLTPIPKPGKNQSQIEGYRPISLLPVLSKLFEKILAKRFWKFTKGQISKLQHAFIPRHGVHSICHQLEEILRRNLGNGKHSLVLSEDLEKAFDRVISSSVIMELHRWGVPVQILQLVKSFLENRRITVKVDGYFSSTYNLDNGVPQGSPLSVVLYNIYANSLANSIQDLPGIDYVGIYADNIFAVASGNPKSVQISLNNMDRVIQNWSKENGAVIPTKKAEILHVCRKRDCNNNTICLGNENMRILDQMRILGIIFTKNLLWNTQIKNLSYKLAKINNLLKLICSRGKGPHIETALHEITIYGWTSKGNVNKMNTSINMCFRTASGLLRTTPIEKLRVEANFSDFTSLLEKTAISLASRSISKKHIPDESLHETFWHCLSSQENCSSAIGKTVTTLKRWNISIPDKPGKPTNTGILVKLDDSLSFFNKNSTNPLCFKSMFLEKISYFAPDQIYYTDGSFRDTFTSYSIVKQLTNSQFETLCKNRLPDHSGIFIAEMAAIKSAIKYCSENAGRSLICTDSLSATKALIKNHNGAYNDILHMENMANDITIMWIPSHIGIPGNEYADKGAKEALKLQNVTEVPCLPKALTKPFNALYDLQNHVPKRPKYSEILSRSQCIMLARLRVGKAVFNSRHYYERTDPPICSHCNVYLTIPHILTECQLSKIDQPLEKILDCQKANLPIIIESLEKHNIHEI
ncbi:putative RNA-directed DNA polymerase from transposon X-element [Lucilia cuprina]|nr:putative RNA-directed DNA polymerase from transposon X-element [Lucilia cuprina]